MPEQQPGVAVIGGGVAGLATAWHLENPADGARCNCRVTVFEAASTAGGNLRTEEAEGFRVEWGPNGFLDSEPATLELARAIGLGPDLLRSRDTARRRFLYVRGRLREIPDTPARFVKSDLFSPGAKLRIAGEIAVPARRDLGLASERLETDETVWAFGARRLGRAFADTMLDPMVRGITGGECRRVSLAAAFPRMVELEQRYGGLFRALIALRRHRRRQPGAATGGPTGVLTSFTGGMSRLPHALLAGLRGEVLTGRPVSSLASTTAGWTVTAAGRRYGPFAAIVDAAPAHAAAVYHPHADARTLLAGIRYNPLVVIGGAWRRDDVPHPLDGFGMLTPSSEGSPLLGVLWDSSIWDHRAPAGAILLRAMVGDPAWLDRDDADIVNQVAGEFEKIFGIVRRPLQYWIFRHEMAIAEYEVGHLARLARLDRILAETPGLFLTGSSYRGIAVNHCLKDAVRVADAVRAYLERGGNA